MQVGIVSLITTGSVEPAECGFTKLSDNEVVRFLASQGVVVAAAAP